MRGLLTECLQYKGRPGVLHVWDKTALTDRVRLEFLNCTDMTPRERAVHLGRPGTHQGLDWELHFIASYHPPRHPLPVEKYATRMFRPWTEIIQAGAPRVSVEVITVMPIMTEDDVQEGLLAHP